MNRLFKIIFYSRAYERLKIIKRKQAKRRERIEAAFSYLNKWSDIPLRELFPTVCDTLYIKPDLAAYSLVQRMCMDFNVSDVEKEIPLFKND